MIIYIPLSKGIKLSSIPTFEHYKVCLHTWLFIWVYWTWWCVVHHWILKKEKKTTVNDKEPQNDALYIRPWEVSLKNSIYDSPHLNDWSATFHRDQFMTFFMHQEFAVNAFVALSS